MDNFLHPLREFGRGFQAYRFGVRWLWAHPRYLCLLFIPLSFGLLALYGGWHFFLGNQDRVMGALLFERPTESLRLVLYYGLKVALYLGFFVVSVLSCILVTNVLSAPIYEWVSQAVERDLSGHVTDMGFIASLRLIPEEMKKGFFILVVSIGVLLLPGLNFITLPVTAFLLGWDFYDYPLARQGLPFQKRFGRAMADGWAVMAFGMWLMIPFVQVIMMPLAVAGGTMLGLAPRNGSPLRLRPVSNRSALKAESGKYDA